MASGLGLRVATGVPLALLVVAAALLLSPLQLGALLALVAVLAAWEWSRLAGLQRVPARAAYLATIAALHALVWWWGPGASAAIALPLVAAWWVGFAGWLLAGGHPRAGTVGIRGRWLLAGLVLLPAFSLAVVVIAGSPLGRGLLLYALFLVFVADIGAYFCGRRFGRRRLAPAVSAGKTVEGLLGGLACVALFALAVGVLLDVAPGRLPQWTAIALAAAALSVAGDLFVSVLKREAGAKDSGRLIPGHGGLLDRMDSLLAAVPVQALGFGLLFAPEAT